MVSAAGGCGAVGAGWASSEKAVPMAQVSEQVSARIASAVVIPVSFLPSITVPGIYGRARFQAAPMELAILSQGSCACFNLARIPQYARVCLWGSRRLHDENTIETRISPLIRVVSSETVSPWRRTRRSTLDE